MTRAARMTCPLTDDRLCVVGLHVRAARRHDPAVGIGDVALGGRQQPGIGRLGRTPWRVAPGSLAVLLATCHTCLIRGVAGRRFSLKLRASALKACPARRRIGQLGGQLITACVTEQLVLGCVGGGRFGEDPLDLVTDRRVLPVGADAGVRGDLGAVNGNRADADHPRLRAQRQHAGEQVGQRHLVTDAKASDRGVVRHAIGADHPERDVLLAAPLDPARGALPDRVGVQQQRDHHPRIVRRTAMPVGTVIGVHRAEIDLLDRVEHKPRQMPLGQPVAQARRHQPRLLAITRQKAHRHAQRLFNRSDRTPGYRNSLISGSSCHWTRPHALRTGAWRESVRTEH